MWFPHSVGAKRASDGYPPSQATDPTLGSPLIVRPEMNQTLPSALAKGGAWPTSSRSSAELVLSTGTAS
jgi:hypothetical protein